MSHSALCVIWAEDLLLSRELKELCENLSLEVRILGEGDIFSSALSEESSRPFLFIGAGVPQSFRASEDHLLPFLSDKVVAIWLGEMPPSLKGIDLSHQISFPLAVDLGILCQAIEGVAEKFLSPNE